MKKIDRTELLKFRWYEPNDIVEKFKTVLNDEEYSPEQKLFILGFLLNKNKENYIQQLKQERDELQRKVKFEIAQEKNANKMFLEYMKKKLKQIVKGLDLDSKHISSHSNHIPNPTAAPKKKVVIIKKKQIN